jgi:quinol monooxygenase YgiN
MIALCYSASRYAVKRLLLLLLPAMLLVAAGCTSDPAASASAASDSIASDSVDLPPSRAGDVQPATNYEQALSDLLSQVVTAEGNVRYDLLRGERNDQFRRVLKAVEDFDASRLSSQSAKMAFWINAYNVQMLANVLEAWPVRDVSAHDKLFFNQPLRTAGAALSLDQIENVILRRQSGPERAEQFQVDRLDPRLHAAVNCAARSCPRLRRKAYTPERMGAMLDAAMRDFTGHREHFRRAEDGGDFVFNSILKWYGADFDRPDGTPAGDYLLSFMPEARPGYDALRGVLEGRSAAELQKRENTSFAYDWTLNATPSAMPERASS